VSGSVALLSVAVAVALPPSPGHPVSIKPKIVVTVIFVRIIVPPG
jgi:hypothetical protein